MYTMTMITVAADWPTFITINAALQGRQGSLPSHTATVHPTTSYSPCVILGQNADLQLNAAETYWLKKLTNDNVNTLNTDKFITAHH